MRLTGPAMSIDASGSFAKTIVFAKWRGLNYGRLHVIPINRNTTGQKTVRSVLGTVAKAVRAVLTKAMDTPITGTGSHFFINANTKAPAGNSWVSYLQKVLNSAFAGLVTAYGVLSSTIKGYYNTEAETIGMTSYTDKRGVTHTAGEQLYLLASFAVSTLGYTGFTAGIDAATSAQCLAFVAYVHTSAA